MICDLHRYVNCPECHPIKSSRFDWLGLACILNGVGVVVFWLVRGSDDPILLMAGLALMGLPAWAHS